jgi:hypothetical protein
MEAQYEIKEVVITYDDGVAMEVDVVIGDGKTKFDENFEFDERIYFYFQDRAEYEKAKGETIDPNIGFRILEVA